MVPNHLLSWMIFFPLIGASLILLVPKRYPILMKLIALAVTIPPLWWAFHLYIQFDRWDSGFQYVEKVSWIRAFNINYFLGIDGISIPMILLTTLLGFLCVIASWNINHYVRGYFSLFLLLYTSMMGVFSALDFFLFYVFWELMLLPMYFLIGVWGGANKEYAAIKFFLFTLVGSVLMLVVMLVFYLGTIEPGTGLHSFDFTILADQSVHQSFLRNQTVRWFSYLALLIGFAIKIPLVPVHTWLPDAHVEAPTAISVILAGLLFKTASFPFHFWCPDVYEGAPTPITAFLSVGPKAAGFALFIRLFYPLFATGQGAGVYEAVAGFVGKVYLFAAVISEKIYWLAVVAALNTVVSLYYYLRVVKAMFLEPPTDTFQPQISLSSQAILTALLLPTLGLGLYWQPLAKIVSLMF